MKTTFRIIVSVAALFAVLGNALADGDGSLVVMDRVYYEQCRASFYSNCAVLQNDIETFTSNAIAQFQYFYSLNSDALYWVDLAFNNANNLLQSSNLNSSDRTRAELIRDQSGNAKTILTRSLGQIAATTNDLAGESSALLYQVSQVSNSFPLAVTTTNLTLNVYVIVTNTFEIASNDLQQVQNSYTNFLTYFRGIEDEWLDQYRVALTNLLDWSELANIEGYSLWNSGSYIRNYISGQGYYNFIFGGIPWGNPTSQTLGIGPVFNTGAAAVSSWSGYAQSISDDDLTPLNFLLFSLQGIHDSVEYGSRAILQMQQPFLTASTNTVMTYPFQNSYTNAMTQFLIAPDTYTQQVAKIAKSRNLFQRFEHWLSAIAHNTYKDDKPEVSDAEDDRKQQLGNLTNDVNHLLGDTMDNFNQVGDTATNVFVAAQRTFSDNVTAVFNNFTMRGNNRSRGSGDQPAAQLFNRVSFMDVSWFGESLKDKTGKNNDVPQYITIQDIQSGAATNRAWSILLRLLDILHKVFGVLWSLVGFALSIWECIMLFKFFVTIWWRLLKFIPHINRYALGS